MTLIDCGEATQHQLMRSNAKMSHIDNILITHLHGDHCFGLFGLLHTLNMSGRTSPIQIYGPVGVNELVRTVFRLTGGWDASFEFNITELEPDKIKEFDLMNPTSNKKLASVTACPMVHRIPAFGYVLKEPPQPLILNGEKAKKLGAQGPELAKLKSGHDVTLSDGSIVKSEEVTIPNRPSQTVAILQDTRDGSSAVPYMQNCTLLVHEATYDSSRHEQAIAYGHSTSVMAAKIAKQVKAKSLILTHFSSRYGNNGDNDILRIEAENVLTDSRVILAEDFMSLEGDGFSEIKSALKPQTVSSPQIDN